MMFGMLKSSRAVGAKQLYCVAMTQVYWNRCLRHSREVTKAWEGGTVGYAVNYNTGKSMVCPDAPQMCLKEDTGGNKLGCALDWHNDDYFGIYRPDRVK